MGNNNIETNADRLVRLVNTKGQISFKEASKSLEISMSVISELADILQEENIISVEYHLTTPVLLSKKITQKELNMKAKEISTKKDIFQRKAEGYSLWMKNEASQLKNVQQDFENIKKDLGIDIDKIKEEIKELDRYHDTKIKIDKELETQKQQARDKIESLNKDLNKQSEQYNSLIEGVAAQNKKIETEKSALLPLKKIQGELQAKTNELGTLFKDFENRIKEETQRMQIIDNNFRDLQEQGMFITEKAHCEKESLAETIKKSSIINAEINSLQKNILDKVVKLGTSTGQVKVASQQIKTLFNKKIHTIDLISRINRDGIELEKELNQLIKKAKLFKISSKDKSPLAEINDLEKMYKSVSDKKKKFEEELKDLKISIK